MNNIIQISTYPFCDDCYNKLLETNWELHKNPYHRMLYPDEVIKYSEDATGIIAGTEPYTKHTIKSCKKLKIIARAGAGFDNIDFETCRRNGIIVTSTPDATIDGVAELALSLILNLLRMSCLSDRLIRKKKWIPYLGFLVKEIKIGILGVGRTGGRLAQILHSFSSNLYGCDLVPNIALGKQCNITWKSHEDLFEVCDLVSIHIPLNERNFHLVGSKEFSSMKKGSFIVNLSRGAVLNELDLITFLRNKHLGGAALDVFEKEPYIGPLTDFDNVVLTSHIGASTHYTRFLMEMGATEECIRVLSGQKPHYVVWDNV
jgi:D-3-phosphoglycerate dehydrogenase